jgi:hypothetical protein
MDTMDLDTSRRDKNITWGDDNRRPMVDNGYWTRERLAECFKQQRRPQRKRDACTEANTSDTRNETHSTPPPLSHSDTSVESVSTKRSVSAVVPKQVKEQAIQVSFAEDMSKNKSSIMVMEASLSIPNSEDKPTGMGEQTIHNPSPLSKFAEQVKEELAVQAALKKAAYEQPDLAALVEEEKYTFDTIAIEKEMMLTAEEVECFTAFEVPKKNGEMRLVLDSRRINDDKIQGQRKYGLIPATAAFRDNG